MLHSGPQLQPHWIFRIGPPPWSGHHHLPTGVLQDSYLSSQSVFNTAAKVSPLVLQIQTQWLFFSRIIPARSPPSPSPATYTHTHTHTRKLGPGADFSICPQCFPPGLDAHKYCLCSQDLIQQSPQWGLRSDSTYSLNLEPNLPPLTIKHTLYSTHFIAHPSFILLPLLLNTV